ncbi:Isoleucyl-tRNA synthetase [Candidatus Similichlamydia laticola]|uniref:Isoleucine--tRNA ligase n=2 Tax=Candidatus Similichlamydia laticola TaxID=2170265 RepID=A0A369K9T2_9BACT|nr:Isoleucyl-tRNA synthetase [Candidatus Similichlamydia laticola]
MTLSSWWQRHDISNRLFSKKEGRPVFRFYDGPPFATGTPHYGHLLAGTIKDAVLRYYAMNGYSVLQPFGWDAHGLPVEYEVERQLGLSSRDLSSTEFIRACRKVVVSCDAPWKKIMHLLARWVNWESSWLTMDRPFMESVWWVFKRLYEKGLIYEGYKVLPFSWKLGTALSNFEAGENYKEITSHTLVVQFPCLARENTFFLAWTTTPWTLPSNLALLVHPERTYVILWDEQSRKHFCLCDTRVSDFFSAFRIVETFKGSELEGWSYLPPFDCFKKKRPEAFKVILASCVSDEEGTGIVHAAPGFGEDDFLACQRNGIKPVCPVSETGCFTDEVPFLSGQHVLDVTSEIRTYLQQNDLLLKEFPIVHRYPYCWRSDTPLIYRLSESWFLSVEPFRDQLLQKNQEIHWSPAHIQEGRFGKWLAQARDWSISRKRVWGNPLPVWRSEGGELLIMGSCQELENYSGQPLKGLHRDQLDQVSFTYQGKTFKRVDAVFDCWFESGSVPFAQNHYPFDGSKLEDILPADFIAEGVDQTRGWFYTLHVLSVLLAGKPAFRHVIVNGIILAEDGTKMSKRLRNYPDPEELLLQHGADALRLYLLRSVAVKAESICFSEEGVVAVARRILFPLRHAVQFFLQHYQEEAIPFQQGDQPDHILDQWLLSRLSTVLLAVRKGFETYDLFSATASLALLVDDLNNWYIRLSRLRFKMPLHRASVGVLRFFLSQMARLIAPVTPFLAEEIYVSVHDREAISVHLTAFPSGLESDSVLEDQMGLLREIVQVGHSLRKKIKIRVRQPLAKVYLTTEMHAEFLLAHSELIKSELNVKQVVLTKPGCLTTYTVRPNFRVLGRRFGAKVQRLKSLLENLSQEETTSLLEKKEHTLVLDGETISISLHELLIEQKPLEEQKVQSGHGFSLSFETTLNEDLLEEGVVRECISKLNMARKGRGLVQGEPIKLYLSAEPYSRLVLEKNQPLIQTTCFVQEVVWVGREDLSNAISALEEEWAFSFQIG